MDITSYVQEIEYTQGRQLEPSEVEDLDLWLKGRELLHVYGTEAWEIIIATLDAQAINAQAQLLALPPGDDRVGAVHGTAAGITQAVANFKYAIESQVQAAKTMPEVMKTHLRGAKEIL